MVETDQGGRGVGSTRAHRVAVPPGLRTYSQLARVDYQDAFAIESSSVPERTPEEWAKLVVEGSAPRGGQTLWSVFSGLGVLPRWEPPTARDGIAVFRGSSGIGLSAELLFECQEQTLVFATLVRFTNPGARAAWAGLSVVHRRVVPIQMERAAMLSGRHVLEQPAA